MHTASEESVEMVAVEIPRDRLQELAEIRPHIWIGDYLLNWAVIIATFWAFHRLGTSWLLPAAMLIIGARQHALGLLAHDAAHRVACKTRWVNELFAELLTSWPLSFKIDNGYRQWHFHHHRTLGAAADPELSYRRDPVYEGPASFRRIALWFVLDMLGFGTIDLLKFYLEVLPKELKHRIGPILVWLAFFAACVYLDALWVFALWAGSLVTGFWAVFRVRTWTEHVGAELDGKSSSHRFSAGPVARFLFFPHNTYCHYEHHKWSQIPYYNLPRLRALDSSRPIIPVEELLLRFDHYSRHPAPEPKRTEPVRPSLLPVLLNAK